MVINFNNITKEKKVIEVCDILLLNKQNKILMQLRDNKKGIYGQGKWGVLGGKKNDGETPEECISREIREELEIELNGPKLINIIEDEGSDYIFKHYIFLDFINKNAGDLKLNEGTKVGFYTLGDLLSLDRVAWFNNLFLNILKKYVHHKSNIK